MDIKEIKRIIELIKDNELSEFELQEEGFRISVKRKVAGGEPQVVVAPNTPQVVMQAAAAAAAPAAAPAPAPAPSNLVEIKSPMVGTFYRSSSPEAEPYSSIGQDIDDESVVCIVEAMKVMNEIKAEVRGTIAKVLVNNAEAVEFGQPLFLVKPS